MKLKSVLGQALVYIFSAYIGSIGGNFISTYTQYNHAVNRLRTHKEYGPNLRRAWAHYASSQLKKRFDPGYLLTPLAPFYSLRDRPVIFEVKFVNEDGTEIKVPNLTVDVIESDDELPPEIKSILDRLEKEEPFPESSPLERIS